MKRKQGNWLRFKPENGTTGDVYTPCAVRTLYTQTGDIPPVLVPCTGGTFYTFTYLEAQKVICMPYTPCMGLVQ